MSHQILNKQNQSLIFHLWYYKTISWTLKFKLKLFEINKNLDDLGYEAAYPKYRAILGHIWSCCEFKFDKFKSFFLLENAQKSHSCFKILPPKYYLKKP